MAFTDRGVVNTYSVKMSVPSLQVVKEDVFEG